MRRLIVPALLLSLAAPAAAGTTPESELGRVAHAMGDPASQHAMARAIGAMAEAVLDLPLAPIMAPIAQAAGEDPRTIDPDATLRRMSPAAGDVPRLIERQLPAAMGAMAGMSGAAAALLPQLRAAVDRVRDAMPATELAELP